MTAEAKYNKSFFKIGMIFITNQASIIVIKYRFSFLKRDGMLLLIRTVFVFIPDKAYVLHMVNIII